MTQQDMDEGPGEHLRERKGYQGTTDHYKVQNVPQVTEVGSLMKYQT